MIKKFSLLIVLSVLIHNFSVGQDNNYMGQEIGKDRMNVITTAAPMLMIAPDSRAGAMGDVGVATSPDANSMHWNPAKYAFADRDAGVALSYTPWLSKLVDDINLSYLSGYKRLNSYSVVAASLMFFSLGEIPLTNESGFNFLTINPSEFSVDLAYSFLLHKYISGSIAFRYIHSNLTAGQYIGETQTHAGKSFASDISTYYQKPLRIQDRKALLAFGLNISNIGMKISYTDDAQQNFIPINMRLGGCFTYDVDEYNSIAFAVDFNKLLVPTPPMYGEDLLTGETIIISGRDPNVGVTPGIFGSFTDAPGVAYIDTIRNQYQIKKGSILKEELSEINYSIGLEYWYAQQFALRGGFFHEHQLKGNREYFTLGVGLKLNVFGLDFSYLIPTTQHNPLENTLRFTLLFDFEGFKRQSVETPPEQ